MKTKLFLLIGLMSAILITGCASEKKANQALDEQLTQVVNTYFTALKEKNQSKLYPVVTYEVYRAYTPSRLAEQQELLGDIITWKIDGSVPPEINTNAGQALYTVNMKTSKRALSLLVDIRSEMDTGWKVWGVEVKKQSNTDASKNNKEFNFGADNSKGSGFHN